MNELESLKLSLIDWGIVLRVIRAEVRLCHEVGNPADLRDLRKLSEIEDQIIDLAFKEHSGSSNLKKKGD